MFGCPGHVTSPLLSLWFCVDVLLLGVDVVVVVVRVLMMMLLLGF